MTQKEEAIPYQPTPEQRLILAHDRHLPARVLAGPGTGKSVTMVAFLNQLLEAEPQLRAKLITFTRAATAELARTVSDHANQTVQRPSTIHSFAISILLRNPGAGNFPKPLRIADDYEDSEIIRPTLARRINVHQTRLNALFREMASDWEFLEHRELPRIDNNDRIRFNAGWNQHRQVMGYTLLAELPFALRHALINHDNLQGCDFDLLVVDEYQDLNACELGILRSLAQRGCTIVAAGDDDQSIYSFRYASPIGIREFPQQYEHCHSYDLTVTQRCSRRIVEWASHVIQHDLTRAADRALLQTIDGARDGETALLRFADGDAEARGVAELASQLININGIAPSDILILLRGDNRGMFSRPIKDQLDARNIPYSNPDGELNELYEPSNRAIVATCRLFTDGRDSLAWASLMKLAAGIGGAAFDYIYDRAAANGVSFGQELFDSRQLHFPGGPRNMRNVEALITRTLEWHAGHEPPDRTPEGGWGHWLIENSGDIAVPTDLFRQILFDLDELVEPGIPLAQFLSQLTPLCKDHALASSGGIRIMSMDGSKGLTVRAAIVAGLDHGVIPRPNADQNEECRRLYVAMTRAKEFLFGTWAQQRHGPAARAGGQAVGDFRDACAFLRNGPVQSVAGNPFLQNRGQQ